MGGLLFQGAEVDRWLLSGTDRAAFEAAAREVQSRLTDEVIDAAMKSQPPEWYALSGERLSRDLKRRRDLLPDAAREFYKQLAGRVDIRGTGKDDVVRVERGADGSVVVEIAFADGKGGAGEPWFRRRFLKGETQELRIYLWGGADRVTTSGPRKGGITVRVSGGPGKDVLDDSASGGTKFCDVDTREEVREGPGTDVSTARWERQPYKKEAEWLDTRDFGGTSLNQPLVWWEPDPGVILSFSKVFVRNGFRKRPYAQHHSIGVDYKAGRDRFKVHYDGHFPWTQSRFMTTIELWADGAKNYNFYGLGNETSDAGDDVLYDADQQQIYLFPAVVAWGSKDQRLWWGIGPSVTFARDLSPDGSLVKQQQPYGFGDFTQAGARFTFKYDTRGWPVAPVNLGAGGGLVGGKLPARTGLRTELDAYLYPRAWDVEQTFGAVEGWVAGYWGPASWLTLASRVGGRMNWGDYPWHEAAFLGGADSVRGYRRQRYAGDSAFFASVEARFPIGTGKLVIPAQYGLFALADAGRVWLEGESSDRWHSAYGGGLWMRILPLPYTVFHAAVAKGPEADGLRFYVNFGFTY